MAKPFTDVEMMLLSKMSYGDFCSQHFNSDGSAKREVNLAEALKDNDIVDTLYDKFDKSVVDSFLAKADQYTIVKSYEDPSKTGFAAIALEGPEKGTVTVAARGTQMDSASDLITDLQLGLENETMQQRAMNTFMEDLKSYDSVYLTGHSLGGNLAVSGAVGFDDPSKIKGVVTFNAPGQNAAYITTNQKNVRKVKGKITNYQNEGDFISDINIPVGEVVVVESGSGDNFELTSEFRNHNLDDMKYTKDGFKISKKGKEKSHYISQYVMSCITSGVSTLNTIWSTISPNGIIYNYLKDKFRDEVIATGSQQNIMVEEKIFINPEGIRNEAAKMLTEQENFVMLTKQLRNLVITLKDDHVWDSPATNLFIENYLSLHENFEKFSVALKEYSELMKAHSNGMENLDQHLAGKISKITM